MITIKTKEEIDLMHRGGKVLKSVIDELGRKIDVGVSGKEIESEAEKLIQQVGGVPNFKGEDGFPSCLCFSINEEIVHSVPSERRLKDGDIVTIDLGIFFQISTFLGGDINYKKYPNLKNGFHTDMARTYGVGNISDEIKRLLKVNKKALKRGISKVRAGVKTGEIGEAIEKFGEREGYKIIKNLCGHGIGAKLHEDPEILHYGSKRYGEIMKAGMVFCIEPMLSLGSDEIVKKGTAYLTDDNSLNAHFEDMVAVTSRGAMVLTD